MRLALAVSMLALCVSVSVRAEESSGPTVKSLPPVVVETRPRSGDTKVDPAVRELKVTFSKDMMTEKMWSFVQVSPESFPKKSGEPRYLDKRTIVLPVTFEPGKAYVVWINKGKFDTFRDEDGHPAVPYLLAFETR